MAEPQSPDREGSERPSFADRLEERARDAAGSGARSGDLSASSLLEEQIALALDQIERLRERGQRLMDDLLRAECDVDTELIQMEQRTPRYSPYRYPEREKLQRRLARVAEEGRRLMVTQAERLDNLHDRLLTLLQKRRQLE